MDNKTLVRAIVDLLVAEYGAEHVAVLVHQAMTRQKPRLPPDNMLIKELELSVRSGNALDRAGYKTVGDVRNAPIENLRAIKRFGSRSLREVQTVINPPLI